MKKIFFLIAGSVMVMALLSSCEFFSTEQERSGFNPKPFNGQASWETTPYLNTRN